MNKNVAVAIDGPGGAGKSTIARMAAKELGFIYVDTGAMYRAIGLYMTENNVDLNDSESVASNLDNVKVALSYEDGVQKVILNGKDCSDKIRTNEISMAASKVSAVPAVRQFLLDTQRNMARTNSVIMDGRDIGTVVLPDAKVKIFLTASTEIRAQRRYKELVVAGKTTSYETVLTEMKERDYNDSHRAIAPLKPADNAVLIDTTELTLEESKDKIISTIKAKLDK